MIDDEAGRMGVAPREPAIRAPWPVISLVLVLVATHAARVFTGGSVNRFALTARDLASGRDAGLLTHIFVHGSWAHVLLNAAFVLAFGVPVARFLGRTARGALLFFGFFLTCGVVAALGFAGIASLGQSQSDWALVGASGAASGLMGAAARLIEGQGRLGSMTGRSVAGMTLGWIAINLVLGLSGLTPGTAGAPVAWEAHIVGYFAGLLLIGPFAFFSRSKDGGRDAG